MLREMWAPITYWYIEYVYPYKLNSTDWILKSAPRKIQSFWIGSYVHINTYVYDIISDRAVFMSVLTAQSHGTPHLV